MALEPQIRLDHSKKINMVNTVVNNMISITENKNVGVITLKSWAISRTRRWKGSFLIKSSVLFWYFRISLFQQLKNNKKNLISAQKTLKKQLRRYSLSNKISVPKSNSSRAVSMGLFYSTSGWCRLPCSLYNIQGTCKIKPRIKIIFFT